MTELQDKEARGASLSNGETLHGDQSPGSHYGRSRDDTKPINV